MPGLMLVAVAPNSTMGMRLLGGVDVGVRVAVGVLVGDAVTVGVMVGV